MDTNTLKETLAYLLKLYVIDRGLSYKGIQGLKPALQETGSSSPSFAEIIRELKSRYPLKELESFSIEKDRVYISIQGEKYQITEGNSPDSAPHNREEKKEDLSPDIKTGNDGQSPCGRFEKLEME
jgi:predicted heme/steroid binding protein